ncbi:uncharacterized protein [Primulina eburnea]|uniref:uncharacterized protein n=1 Tax=Primulina eburnea TaxID=1245227 RepID=UPI003C6C9E93
MSGVIGGNCDVSLRQPWSLLNFVAYFFQPFLFFADDMVLFAEASNEQIQVILECMNKFCIGSGQRINRQKSQIYVSKNVDITLANSISTFAGIPLTNDLGRYLGVPSIHERVKGSLFKQVLEKLKARLEG